MDDQIYQKRAAFIHAQLQKAGVPDGSVVLDLGCRDGSLTEALTDAGYEMIGVDPSADLLAAAMDKMIYDEHKTLYIQQDLKTADLGCQMRAIVSTDGVLNELRTEADLSSFFGRVSAMLETEGVFFFDFSPEPEAQGSQKAPNCCPPTLALMKDLLLAAGLSFVQAFSDYTEQEPDEKSRLICVLARK